MSDPYSFGGSPVPYLTGTLQQEGVNPNTAQNWASGNLGSLVSGGSTPAAPGTGALGGVGALAAGGALAYDLLGGNPASAPEQALQNEAGQLGAEGTQLTQQGQGLQAYLEQGTLPPAQQAQLELQKNAAKARIIQGAGSRGQNTNPLGNSGLTQDLNSLGLQSEVEKGKLEEQLFQAGNSLITQGNQALGMEVGIQEKLAQIDAQQQADTTNAIMGFAKALGGMDWSKIGSSLATLAPLAVAA